MLCQLDIKTPLFLLFLTFKNINVHRKFAHILTIIDYA